MSLECILDLLSIYWEEFLPYHQVWPNKGLGAIFGLLGLLNWSPEHEEITLIVSQSLKKMYFSHFFIV